MSDDIWTLERAAFACFRTKLEDSYKRLLFMRISNAVTLNPNVTANKCFHMLKDSIPVEREDFDAAIRALEVPFGRLKIDSYTKRSSKHHKEQPTAAPFKVLHLNASDSDQWNNWLNAVLEKYPELSVWQRG